MLHGITRACSLGLVLSAVATCALAEMQDQEVFWTAPAATGVEAQRAQEDLYLNLFNTGRLRFKLVPMGDHKRLEDVMRDQGAWVGPMTEPVAAMLCAVNGSGCNLTTAPVAQAQITDHGAHVAGIVGVGQNWTVGKNDLVWIPDVEIVQVSTPAPAENDARVEIRGLNVQNRCLSADYCVNDYQPDIPGWNVKGRLREVVVATRDAEGQGRALKLIPELNARIELSEDPLPDYQSIKSQNSLPYDFRDPSFLKLDAGIGAGIVGTFSIESQSTTSDSNVHALSGYQREPLSEHSQKLFDHFCNTQLHGSCPDLSDKNLDGLVIGVMDQTPEHRHCDLDINAKVLVDNEFVPTQASGEADDDAASTDTAVGCDTMRLAGQVQGTDHGTHVLGIIAAPQNQRGISGLLGGFEDLSYLLIPFSETDGVLIDEAKARQLADAIDSAGSLNVSVINLSFSYNLRNIRRADKIGEAIKKWHRSILFVVAAGKGGNLFTAPPVSFGQPDELPPCLSPPACYASHVENIIGVVGLETDQDNLKLLHNLSDPTQFRTNYGASVFDIGAPARDILSTVGVDGFGPLSGTSQAAPQVTAAAALLKKISGANPIQVRQRLTYTARMSMDSIDKINGGALDATAALRIDKDWLHMADNCKVAGEFITLVRVLDGTPQEGSFDIVPNDQGPWRYVPKFDMRRIHWNADENKGVFFFRDGRNFTRMVASYLSAQGKQHFLRMRVDRASEDCADSVKPGSVAEFQLSQVVDYISQMD